MIKTIVYVIEPHRMMMRDYIREVDHQVYYINDKPENDKYHASLGLCGLEITQLHADSLTADQIEYLCIRIRSIQLGEPSNDHHVNIWNSPDGVMVTVGEYSFLRTRNDRVEFQRWLDEVLV